MKKIIYVLLSFYFVSCTNLDSERYDTINPGFFPNTEKDADALITASVYAPFRNSDYNGIFNCASGIQIIGDMTTD